MNETIIKDYTVNKKCSGCGECCSNLLPISIREIKIIKSYIKKYKIKEQRHNFMVGSDMTCPFRDDLKKKCLIYEVRPAICRQFMCNYTMEDILKAKKHFHENCRVVFMRSEFYGKSKDEEAFLGLFGG